MTMAPGADYLTCTLPDHERAACRAPLEVRDVTVGAGQQEFMHTITGGQPASPPLVLVPGYALPIQPTP